MRITALISLLILATIAAYASTPIATWTPQLSDGIEIVPWEDGQFEAKTVAGREAVNLRRRVGSTNYHLYFKLAPEVRARLKSDTYLVVDFYDRGVGRVGVQFNSASNPYEEGPGFTLAAGTKWEQALIHLTNVKFEGKQNGGADFRFIYALGLLSISRVEIYADKPDLQLPSDKERLMKVISQNPKPTDMFYTFGNDADEASALVYKSLGVTSIESYVTWETIEGQGKDQWDWSKWDKQVKILQDNDLKWVPFLILGPAYSTPNWFRAGSDHFPCRCLEHGTDSKIESLWNPNLPKWIDRFIGEFAKRYRDTGVIESVLLGIQGDYGEAIYSVSGGGWTFSIPGEYHNHAGYWCDDPYALADFRKFVQKRYGTLEKLNKTWGAQYKSFEEADFPGRKEALAEIEKQLPPKTPEMRRRRLDFIDWYRDAMTRWADWWIAVTRKHFPHTPIYLCTGGDAEPHHGSNFAEQCRVAAKNKAGVRITNEASDYARNFAITRWVASAGKHYSAYYGFEPAGAEDERGIVARIYNATASGANQLHDYNPNVMSSPERKDAQEAHFKYLFHVPKPLVPVALWYPNVTLTCRWGEGYLGKAAELRDYTDFDYLDETMLRSKALDRYKILVILHGDIMETEDARLIARWIQKGGRLIVMDVPKFESVEGTDEPEDILNCRRPDVLSVVGGGLMHRVQDMDGLAAQLREDLLHFGLPVYDLKADGIFGTQIGPERFLFLNTTDKEATVPIGFRGKTTEAKIKPGTITDIRI